MSKAMKFHPYAEFFPLLEGEGFQSLVDGIREHGLLEPIVIYKGKILDGRNRYRACREAEREPHYREYEGDSPATYVWEMNANRRDLTPTQKGVIRIDMKDLIQDEIREELREHRSERAKAQRATGNGSGFGPLPDGRPVGRSPGEWVDRAAAPGVSAKTIRRVDRVAREAPEFIPKMRSGQMSAREAEREVRKRKARESAARDRERETKKKREEPREVKVYLEALRAFREAVREAVDVAEFGKFSPEAQRFVNRWHEDIRGLLAKVEEGFDA